MKISVLTSDDGWFEVENFESDTLLELVEALNDPEIQFLAFQLDQSMAYVNKAHLVRMDVD